MFIILESSLQRSINEPSWNTELVNAKCGLPFTIPKSQLQHQLLLINFNDSCYLGRNRNKWNSTWFGMFRSISVWFLLNDMLELHTQSDAQKWCKELKSRIEQMAKRRNALIDNTYFEKGKSWNMWKLYGGKIYYRQYYSKHLSVLDKIVKASAIKGILTEKAM